MKSFQHIFGYIWFWWILNFFFKLNANNAFFFLLIGLFTADQNVCITGGSTCTRQNPNGMRRGFECPEERDYFPYWHPTVWVDIFVYAQNASMCDYYKKHSFNSNNKCKYNYILITTWTTRRFNYVFCTSWASQRQKRLVFCCMLLRTLHFSLCWIWDEQFPLQFGMNLLRDES